MKARILIAGGYGLVGSFIARHVRKLSKEVELILAGRNPEKGAALARELGGATTARLDVSNAARGLSEVGHVDLIVAALQDPGDNLIHAALSRGVAHIGITKLAEDVAPATFAALRSPPTRPIVLLGHWQAGVLLHAAWKAAEPFSRVDSIQLAGLYDTKDPIGQMTASDSEHFVGRALLREAGAWKWLDATQHVRDIRLSDGRVLQGLPMSVLDVPSLAAVTGAPNVRFDFVQGDSLGTLAGGPASHDLYIDIEGLLKEGTPARRRTMVSGPAGNAHLTALGVLVVIERVLGLDGRPAAPGGLHLPETLVAPDEALARFKEFGVHIASDA
ncbi:Rossmann-fold NAD(P)-binding domain-containing protein [Archangium lipolyticum]|uniref:hypothetical protein n=1 Tax=Archangium lipolyticum TaxID=2970465 RepID=UPI002149A404|nr:hypothetical protein [Archangium lipolyticum]